MDSSDDRPVAGEVQKLTDAGWRTAHLGENVPVRDRRRVVADREPTFAPLRPGEVAGTREISDAERELLERLAPHVVPLPPGAGLVSSWPPSDLADTDTRPNSSAVDHA